MRAMTMVRAEVQHAAGTPGIPATEQFRRWAGAVRHDAPPATVCIRVVDDAEMAALNARYRRQAGVTNVLAFEADSEAQARGSLGDLVICAPQVLREAHEYACTPEARFAHMTVHGVLHLLGHTHDAPEPAARMEALEQAVLAELGYPDPYVAPS